MIRTCLTFKRSRFQGQESCVDFSLPYGWCYPNAIDARQANTSVMDKRQLCHRAIQ